MQIIVGTWQRCHWQCLVGAIDTAGWERYIEHMWSVHPRLERGDVILDLWHDTGRPSPKSREQFTSSFMQADGLDRVHGHAFVTNSALSRGVLTAVNWVVKRPFPEKLFASPDDAMPWLQGVAPALDLAGLQADLRAKVPGYAALRW